MNEELKQEILNNFKNTELGLVRIKRNLCIGDLSDIETEDYLRVIIVDTPLEAIVSKGKNHYFNCEKNNAILTINGNTHSVITAKKIVKN